MRYMLILLGLMFANVANAIDCQKLPSCEELGYSKESVKGCAEGGYLTCPFDESYKKCVNYDCEALGFTNSDKTSWCADLIECKGNPQMTLCQKACVATNAQELKELAESGKCKVVTMRNDIIIPENESITLAANTIIDGGNHTLKASSNKQNSHIFNMQENTGFKNIFITYQSYEEQNGNVIFYSASSSAPISLQDFSLKVVSDIDKPNGASIFNAGKYTISGRFGIDVQAKYYYTPFEPDTTPSFINADVDISVKSIGHAIFVGNVVVFENSKAKIVANNCILSVVEEVRIKNSEVSMDIAGSLTYIHKDDDEQAKIYLLEGGHLSHQVSVFAYQNKDLPFYLQGSAENPATLTLNTSDTKAEIITSTNTTDTLTLNGITYHPTTSATTTLTDIPNSPNWRKE